MATQGLIGAVEAGGTKFVLALATFDGEIVAHSRLPTNTPVETWPAMQEFFTQNSARHGPISAFGIASFGPIDIDPASAAYGTFTTTPKPGWSGARFHDALASFNAPIMVDTDVNGAAIGEWQAGAGQGCRTLAYTTIGTGVGTGIVRDGRSLMGISHFESGHIVPPQDFATDPFGGICPYHGNCIEGLASGPAIEKRWGRSLDKLLGEANAISLIADYIAHLASTLVLLHMPDRLIFGGGVMKAPGLIEAVRTATAEKLNGYVQHPRLDAGLTRYIVTPGLGDDAGITGAIELGRQALAAQ
ncbi:MAG: fructokinase [Novosphingobium sp. 32-60-15]|uniref:ROK family protein n=1 Tax=unclassified Novosphingobium TaxID=2644732 RepID=UPI000BD10F82|nr:MULTISPECIES: ROK family protein [unclassified Novosphingobium]OYX63877.1 MAG: fructokinase [Novosphingobium sp. 32-60-15]